MTHKQIEATLRLFKGYIAESNTEDSLLDSAESIKYGVIFKSSMVPYFVYNAALEMYGKKPEEWNQTFHKSPSIVKDTPIEVLVVQQIVHYLTTYGFEALGIYDKDTVYIPKEKLEIPELVEDNIKLAVINELTEKELTEILMKLLTSGIALSKETVEDIMNLSDFIDKEQFDEIKNKEVRTALYKKYNIMPKNPEVFLRYLVYELTEDTLLIKNDTMINKLKNSDLSKALEMIQSYANTNGYEKLSEIFLRYKDLFLAFKSDKGEANISETERKYLNKIINKVSKLSKTYHKPLTPKVLDTLTQLTDNDLTDKKKKQILAELDNVTTFMEIRLLNALKYRYFTKNKSIVYKIRNGKAYTKDQDTLLKLHKESFKELYMLIANHLSNRISNKVKDKYVYIPKEFNYTAPQSEKQFMGNVPEGSYIEIPKNSNIVIGVHWNNLPKRHECKDKRVDLDLKMQDKTIAFGWDTSYRDTVGNILFSGDITDPDDELGATEVFLVNKKTDNKAFLLTLNKYTGNSAEVPFEIIIAESNDNQVNKNYMVDPNKVLVKLNSKFNYNKNDGTIENQLTLGLVVIKDEVIRLYFNDMSLGNSIVSRNNNIISNVYDYLLDYTNYQIRLDKLLKVAGADIKDVPEYTVNTYLEKLETTADGKEHYEVVSKERVDELIAGGNEHLVKITTEVIKPDYDLSFDSMSKDTIIDLLTEDI